MITQLLGIFGDVVNTLKAIIVLLLVIGIIFIYFYIEEMRPIISIVFVILIIGAGVGATIQNVKYFTTNNVTIGEVLESTFASTNNIDETEPGVFELSGFGFKQIDENKYQSTFKKPAVTSLDFEKEKYVLYINDYKCYINQQGDNYLHSEFEYAFYNEDFDLILVDKLIINISLNANETTIIIQTMGGQSAVELWKSFQAKNNFVMSFKTATAEDFNFNVGGLDDANMA